MAAEASCIATSGSPWPTSPHLRCHPPSKAASQGTCAGANATAGGVCQLGPGQSKMACAPLLDDTARFAVAPVGGSTAPAREVPAPGFAAVGCRPSAARLLRVYRPLAAAPLLPGCCVCTGRWLLLCWGGVKN